MLAFYWLVRLLWPRRRLAATAMALLFAVYPGFLQLPNAATFQNHFIGYGAALTSMALTVAALHARGWKKALLTGLAMLCALGYLLIYEYMIGLEGMRLILIAYVIRQDQPVGMSWKKTVALAARAYLPYLLVAGGFVFWRLALFSSNRPATNTELLLNNYLAAPGAAAAQLLADGLKDFVETVWMAWSVPLYTLWSNARPGDLAVGLLLGAAGGLALLRYARRFAADENEAPQQDWARRRDDPGSAGRGDGAAAGAGGRQVGEFQGSIRPLHAARHGRGLPAGGRGAVLCVAAPAAPGGPGGADWAGDPHPLSQRGLLERLLENPARILVAGDLARARAAGRDCADG